MTARTRFLLPPRPRRRDWWTAGASAGLLLGLAEVGVLLALRVELPPRLALVLVLGPALLVALPAGLMGLGLALARARPSHSELVGGVLGALLAAPAAGAAAGALTSEEPPGVALAAVGAMLLLAAAAGLTGFRVLSRFELAGLPASGPLVWGGAALVLALAARGLGAPPAPLPAPALLAGAVAAGSLAAVLLFVRAMRRRRSAIPQPPGRVLLVLLALAVALAFGPRWLPWALYDSNSPPIGDAPPNVVLLGLGLALDRGPEPQRGGRPDAPGAPARGAEAPGPGAASRSGVAGATPNLAVLVSSGGVVYERVLDPSRLGVTSLTGLAGGAALLDELRARGYATAAVLADPSRPVPGGAGWLDAPPGAGALLARYGRETTAGSLLLAAPRLPGLLALDAARRRPAEVTGAALRWLLGWRSTRAEVPFALLVDYEAAGAGGHGADLDEQLGRLVTALVNLEVADRTLLVVTGAATEPAGAGFAVYVRAPDRLALSHRGRPVRRPIPASDFAEALILLPERERSAPLLLPGGVLGEPAGGGPAAGPQS